MTDAAITDSVMHMYERVSFITEQAAGWQFCTTLRKEQLESGSHIDMQTHASPALTHLLAFYPQVLFVTATYFCRLLLPH